MKHNAKENHAAIKDLSANLKSKIFGQDHIVDEVVDTLMVSYAGLGDSKKPIASFLFAGPTGVGKTEFAIELAKHLDMHLARFDMSEYSDDYSTQNLIGAHKGLVGHGEGGVLTNAIRKHPKSVLLIDEMEKAHPTIYDIFLQILDYGTLTDTEGEKIDFTQTIIIMTTNLGATSQRRMGIASMQSDDTSEAIAEFLRPEFRNRFDKMLKFNPMDGSVVLSIAEKYLEDLSHKLGKKGIGMVVTDEAKKALVSVGYDRDMGARSMLRAINCEFKEHISKQILFGDLSGGGSVDIGVSDEGFTYRYTPSRKEDTYPQSDRSGALAYDFPNAYEAQAYAKAHPGVFVTRSSCGEGYVICRDYR